MMTSDDKVEQPPPPMEQAPTSSSKDSNDEDIKSDVFEADGSEEDLEDDTMNNGLDDNNPETSQEEPEASSKLNIARREDRWVFRLRILTGVVLLSVAVAVCVFVYLDGRNTENDDFEQDFLQLGEKVVETFEATVRERFGIIESYAQEISAQSTNQNGTALWPYVLPDRCAYRSDTVARLAQLFFVIMINIVQPSQVNDYVAYTKEAIYDWKPDAVALDEGIPVEEVGRAIQPPLPTIIDFHTTGKPVPAMSLRPQGPFYSTWCSHPGGNDTTVNLDLGGDVEHRTFFEDAISTGRPTVEKIDHYWDPNKEKDLRYDRLKDNPFAEYLDDAHSVSMFPLFESVENAGPGKPVAGILMVLIYWRSYFDNLLPPGSNGIVIVLENDCGQKFTYQVDGSNSRPLGPEDLHDKKYDHLARGTTLEAVLNSREEDGNAADSLGCHYNIWVYPSQELEDSYRTDKPWIYAVALAALFIFTSAVFVLFAYVVERRQRLVLQSALQSGQLVSSLFPEEVREKLYEEQAAQAKLKQKRATWQDTNNNNNNTMTGTSMHGAANGLTSVEQKAAIANLYPETTILLADMVGFTAWSSKRSPADVFSLLETIFGEFDRIASKKGVFKVETIGDCYVAATGLPEPMKDHAVTMCRFANMCMQRTHQLTRELAETLGPDTADLTMRFGIHSGPTTAGVLRGQKARFQLFGDTINTASRMESNGQAGRIHCSQETANVLISRGKAHWITAREDMIVAKGKGEMQTYWVEIHGKASTTKSGTMSIGTSSIIGSGSGHGSSDRDMEEEEDDMAPRFPPTANGASME